MNKFLKVVGVLAICFVVVFAVFMIPPLMSLAGFHFGG